MCLCSNDRLKKIQQKKKKIKARAEREAKLRRAAQGIQEDDGGGGKVACVFGCTLGIFTCVESISHNMFSHTMYYTYILHLMD